MKHHEKGQECLKRLLTGASSTATVDILDQRRTRPTGMEAPPTITPRTVRSQVRLMDAAFRMQQKLKES